MNHLQTRWSEAQLEQARIALIANAVEPTALFERFCQTAHRALLKPDASSKVVLREAFASRYFEESLSLAH